MVIINCLLAIFILFTILAPVCMHFGYERIGRLIYLFFRQFCHQFAFRSWFLFGEQAYYPKALDGRFSDEITYEDMFGLSSEDEIAARSLLGNEQAGYKIAICQRDFAMYSAILIFGIIFSISGNKIKRIPLWIWLVLGALPLAIDGITQLFSSSWKLLSLIDARESTPLIRTITGFLFGIFSGMYLFPSIEESFWADKSRKLSNDVS